MRLVHSTGSSVMPCARVHACGEVCVRGQMGVKNGTNDHIADHKTNRNKCNVSIQIDGYTPCNANMGTRRDNTRTHTTRAATNPQIGLNPMLALLQVQPCVFPSALTIFALSSLTHSCTSVFK